MREATPAKLWTVWRLAGTQAVPNKKALPHRQGFAVVFSVVAMTPADAASRQESSAHAGDYRGTPSPSPPIFASALLAVKKVFCVAEAAASVVGQWGRSRIGNSTTRSSTCVGVPPIECSARRAYHNVLADRSNPVVGVLVVGGGYHRYNYRPRKGAECPSPKSRRIVADKLGVDMRGIVFVNINRKGSNGAVIVSDFTGKSW